MKKEHATHDRDLGHLIERQVRNWEFSQSMKLDRDPVVVGEQAVQDFITISREVGLPGEEVAAAVNEKCGWPVFDREILTVMAGDDEYRHQIYSHLDGRDLSWLEVFMLSMSEGGLSREDYFHRLTATVLALARKGRAVFLGRGADLILPRNLGLRVRLIAGTEYRMKRYAAEKGIQYDYAVRQADEIEAERAKFFKAHFRVNIGDPARFDLIVNMERMSMAQTTNLIVSAARQKGLLK